MMKQKTNTYYKMILALESYFHLIKRNVFLERLQNSEKVSKAENKIRIAIQKQIKDIMSKNNIGEYLLSDNFKQKLFHDFVRIEFYLDKDVIYDFLVYAGNKGGQNGLNKVYRTSKFMKQDKTPPVFNLVNQGLLKEFQDRTNLIIDSVDSTTLEALQTEISLGIQEGLTVDQVSKNISAKVGDMAQWRAERIVRTETANASSRIEVQTSKELGIYKHSWITSGDNRVAVVCNENSDQGAIPVGEPFVNGATHPPQHPNCRCFLDPEIPDDFDLDRTMVWTGE